MLLAVHVWLIEGFDFRLVEMYIQNISWVHQS